VADQPYAPQDLARRDDRELVRLARALRGAGAAEEESARRCLAVVLLRNADLVRSIIAAKVPRAEVDDLESQVHVRFVGRVHGGRDIDTPAGLLVRIAQRVRADFHARRDEPEARLDGWDVAVEDDALEEELDRQAVEELLAPLGERERRILWQRKIEGRPSAEVAAAEGLSPGNVDVIVCRALAKLREAAS
jgi:RNA polymerase sigma factor (sigma-70 family)